MARTKNPEREAERRQEIVLAAFRLLATRSHQAMTLEAVAKELKGSKGAVAHYFKTKEALIAATMRAALEFQAQALLTIAELNAPLPERLQLLIEAALPDGALTRERVRFVTEVWSFAKTSAETATALRTATAHLHEVTRRLLEIGKAEGFITVERPERFVVPISALFDGLALHAAHSEVDLGELRAQARESLERLLGIRNPASAE